MKIYKLNFLGTTPTGRHTFQGHETVQTFFLNEDGVRIKSPPPDNDEIIEYALFFMYNQVSAQQSSFFDDIKENPQYKTLIDQKRFTIIEHTKNQDRPEFFSEKKSAEITESIIKTLGISQEDILKGIKIPEISIQPINQNPDTSIGAPQWYIPSAEENNAVVKLWNEFFKGVLDHIQLLERKKLGLNLWNELFKPVLEKIESLELKKSAQLTTPTSTVSLTEKLDSINKPVQADGQIAAEKTPLGEDSKVQSDSTIEEPKNESVTTSGAQRPISTLKETIDNKSQIIRQSGNSFGDNTQELRPSQGSRTDMQQRKPTKSPFISFSTKVSMVFTTISGQNQSFKKNWLNNTIIRSLRFIIAIPLTLIIGIPLILLMQAAFYFVKPATISTSPAADNITTTETLSGEALKTQAPLLTPSLNTKETKCSPDTSDGQMQPSAKTVLSP